MESSPHTVGPDSNDPPGLHSLGNPPVVPKQVNNALAVCIEDMGRIIPELEGIALNLRCSAANLRQAAVGLRSMGVKGLPD